MVRKSLLYLVLLFLFIPYAVIFFHLKGFVISDEIIPATVKTLEQAFLSSFFVLVFGFLGSLGISSIQDLRKQKIVLWICLVPSFLPSLFYTLSLLQLMHPFPFGLWGIVLTHVLIGTGLASVLFFQLLQDKATGISELSYLEGASQFHFSKKLLKNLKHEVFLIFLFFFIQYWTSLSIPLLVGQQFQTLETLVYKQILTSGSLSSSFVVAAFEILMVLLILSFYKPISSKVSTRQNKVYLLNQKYFLGLLFLPSLIYLAGTLLAVFDVLKNPAESFMTDHIWQTAFESVCLALAVGTGIFLMLSTMLLNFDAKKVSKIIFSYIPLSTILIGISFLFIKIKSDISPLALSAFALIIFWFPTLYRFQLKENLDSLNSQIEVAKLMGAKPWMIFYKIIFPQMAGTIFFLCGLGAFWAIGDFALTRVIFGQEKILSLVIQNLATHYRIELAICYEIVLLVCGASVFYFFNGLKNVFDQKSKS